MTRAPGHDDEIDYAGAGAPGSERVVVVLRTGALATLDPDRAITLAHDVRLVLVHLHGPELDDPPAYGGETPAGSTAAALARIADRERPEGRFAVVAERATCAIALSLAAELGDRVDPLVLVGPEVPAEALERDLAIPVLQRITAGTLLVAAATEAATVEAVAWFAEHLDRGESTVIPSGDIDAPDGRLSLVDAWSTVLARVSPPAARD